MENKGRGFEQSVQVSHAPLLDYQTEFGFVGHLILVVWQNERQLLAGLDGLVLQGRQS